MIKEGDYVILEKAKFMKIFPVKPNKPVMIDRNKAKLDNLVGQPFGFQYEIKAQQMIMKRGTFDEESTAKDITADNRNLLDSEGNQKLTREEIEALKKNEDVDKNDIVSMIVENSASFQGKTEYSQEKYVKKKKAKYLAQYAVLRPSIRHLCAYYVQGHNKKKVLNMRMDTIAQILTYANVAAHRNVMVVDNCKGLLLAAVLDRVATFGSIVNFSANGSHIACRETLDYMNFPPDYLDKVYNFPLEKCHKPQEYVDDLTEKCKVEMKNLDMKKKREQQLEMATVVNELFKSRSMDCLVIATRFRPLPILERALEHLGSNRYFVVYSATQEPLIECHSWLKKTMKATHMELSDSWLREYQVLPERTHPTVMMDCHGGYLLTGITVTHAE